MSTSLSACFLLDTKVKSYIKTIVIRVVCSVFIFLFVFDSCCYSQNTSQSSIDSMYRALQIEQPDTNKIKILLNIGFEYEMINPDSSISVYDRAYQLSVKNNYSIGKAKAKQYSGIVINEMGRYPEAILNYKQAINWYNEAGYQKGVATTQNNLGNSFLYLGDYKEAVQHFLSSLPYFEEQNDDYSLTVIYGNLGECYRQLRVYDEMLRVARKSYAHATHLNDETEIANAGITLGTALSLNSSPDSATYFLQQSLELGKKLRDPSIQFYALLDLANEDLKKGDGKQALIKADTVLVKAAETQRNYNLIAAHNLRGKCLQQVKKNKDAVAEFFTALSMARQDQALQQQMESLDLISKFYEQTGKPKDAMVYRNEWIALNDSIYNENKSRQIAELRTLYETAEKEKLLAEEKILSAGKDEKIEKRNFYLFGAGIAFVLLLLVAFFIIKANRAKRKLAENDSQLEKERNKALEKEQESVKLRSLVEGQEKERQRVGRELHDGLGGMLTAARLQLEQLGKESGAAMPVAKYLELQNLITKAGKEMRQISHDLDPEGLDKLGLAESLNQFCKRISTKTTSVSFECYGEQWSAGHAEDVSIFRTAQELLNNVLKHADASEAFVSLSFLPGSLTLTVEDNGTGFDIEKAQGKGKGLPGIAARLAFLHASLDVVSRSKTGSSFTITVPRHG